MTEEVRCIVAGASLASAVIGLGITIVRSIYDDFDFLGRAMMVAFLVNLIAMILFIVWLFVA